MTDISIKVCKKMEEVDAGAWDRLLDDSYGPRYQYSYEALKNWQDNYNREWKPLILSIYENSEIIGFFPLMHLDYLRKKIVPYRRLRFFAATSTDFNMLVTTPEKHDLCARAGLDWLAANKLRWEYAVFEDLAEGNPLIPVLEQWLEKNGFRHLKEQGDYFYVDLDRPWEEIEAEMHKSLVVKDVKKRAKQLSKNHEWSFIKNPDWSAEEFIQKAGDIHSEWSVKHGGDSVYVKDETREYRKRQVEIYKNANKLWNYWLIIDGTPAGFCFTVQDGDAIYGWNFAYMQDFSKYSLVKLLLFEMCKNAQEAGLKRFSFSRGDSPWKSNWTEHSLSNNRFRVVNDKSFYGKLVNCMASGFENVKPT